MLSDSGEIPKVKGTRKVGGAGKEKKWDKATPPLPSFFPFYFRFALFLFSGPDFLGAKKRLNYKLLAV